jgi:hypothetical protein
LIFLARLGRPGFSFNTVPAMTVYLLALHLFHLILPAAVLAVLVVTLAGWLPGWRGRGAPTGWLGSCLWTFAANLAVSAAGLNWWGTDGKMATYGAMVIASAVVQFGVRRGWRT